MPLPEAPPDASRSAPPPRRRSRPVFARRGATLMECALLLIGVVLVAGGLWRIFGASVKSGAGSAVEERAVGGGGGGGGAGGGGGGGGGAGGGGGGSRNTGNGSAQHGGPATDTADRELERSLGVAALAAGVIAIGYFLSKARRLKNEVDITGKPPAA